MFALTSNRSLIKILNSMRPNIDPCGTPNMIGRSSEMWDLAFTDSFLLSK